MTASNPLDRKSLTFEQAEGARPLPPQLELKKLSRGLRAALWHEVVQSLEACRKSGYESSWVSNHWEIILRDMHARRYHLMADEFDNKFHRHMDRIKRIFWAESYIEVFGWIQWVLRHPKCPADFSKKISIASAQEGAAYRIVDGNTICPISSEAEIASVDRAFADLAQTEFHGARAHLRNAASELASNNFADSIRESIHAVESVAKSIEPSGELGKALAKLESSVKLHGAMKSGFNSLYGYTSDRGGIRHALLNESEPEVDEPDALFMLGACASFVSYLINKARNVGLLKDKQA